MDTPNVVEQPNQEQAESNENSTALQQDNQTLDAIIAQYSAMTREELTEEMKNLLSKEDFDDLRMRVPIIRNAFTALPKPVIEPVVAEKESSADEQTDLETKTEDKEEKTETQENQPIETKPAEQIDPTEKMFFELYNEYKQKRTQYLEKQEEEKQRNLEKKKVLLEELRVLLDSDKSLKEIYDSFNQIQDKWKEVGNVPHAEANHLWENYHFLIDKFYEKVKINRELRDLDLKKNLEDKLTLCEKAEELLLSDDINMSFQILQEYHRQWKQIGAVPTDKNEEVWERFRKASESINARRKEYYEKRADELESNLKQKQDLLAQAIEINSHQREKISQWNEDADKMNALVEKWKTIGPVPRQYNEEIWNQFKAQKDGFFEARKEMFAHNKQVEEENYNKKVSLCERAEAIVKRTDFDQATKDLLALQEEWKQVGYVKKSLSEPVWLRFRAACDEFFKLKSEEFMRTHQEAEENIKKREQLIDELAEQQFSEDKVENVNIIKQFQKRWFEIGFTPRQERQKLQKKWDSILAANKEKLQITVEEINQRGSRFLNNIAQMGDNGKKAINNRIANLEKQIDSLENNIGFFSASKNSELLKKEFENKLSRLKEEKDNLLKHLKSLSEKKNEEKQVTSSETQNVENKTENTEQEVKIEENN